MCPHGACDALALGKQWTRVLSKLAEPMAVHQDKQVESEQGAETLTAIDEQCGQGCRREYRRVAIDKAFQ
jgi:hypothetical protein